MSREAEPEPGTIFRIGSYPVRAALAALVLAACARRAPVTSCDDDLHGMWVAPAGQAEPDPLHLGPAGARWMMLDNGATLEAYPMFDDAVPPAGTPPDLVLAPRVLDLARTPTLTGELKRRVMRRADTCDARAPVQITRCADDTLELVLVDPPLPLTLAPCSYPAPAPARVERWHRD